ncbi:MAG TPA: CdaR family protein [Thermodesulfobacteriota bacterium]|nr:CdaR family protein [Thermodesulfobacteriota bacterium]
MKGLFTNNLRFKLLAVVFSSALWFFVAGQSSTEVGMLVPLEFRGIPADMAMTSAPPGEIEVRVRGSKLVINNFSFGQVSAVLDLSSAKEGLNTYNILPGDIVTPTGVRVTRIRPGSVDIRMEGTAKAELPVKVRLTGRPAKGYKVAGLKVDPERVEVVGAKMKLKSLKGIYTEPVSVSGLAGSNTFYARLDPGDNDFNSISADRVNVRVFIEKER